MRSPPDTPAVSSAPAISGTPGNSRPEVAHPPSGTEVEAVRSLARAARLLERASGQLSLAHYRILSAIAAGEDRASRVAERFELGRPTVSAAVDALCRAGLVERVEVATDQRALELRLTSAGRDTLTAVETEMVHVLQDLCRRVPTLRAAPATLAALGGALDARTAERHALRREERAAARGGGTP